MANSSSTATVKSLPESKALARARDLLLRSQLLGFTHGREGIKAEATIWWPGSRAG